MNDFSAMKIIMETNHVQVDGPKSDLKGHEYVIEYDECDDGNHLIHTRYVTFKFRDNRLWEILHRE